MEHQSIKIICETLLQVHASESKAMRSSLSGSNGSGTTGANLAYLKGRTEDSPSRDSVSLQHKVGSPLRLLSNSV